MTNIIIHRDILSRIRVARLSVCINPRERKKEEEHVGKKENVEEKVQRKREEENVQRKRGEEDVVVPEDN